MSATPKHIKYRADIDGLRALAVLAVVLFHFEFDLFKGGYIGVDIFFVISGYLITKIITNEIVTTGTLSIKNFYYRRTKRILPVYLACIFVSAAIGALFLSTIHFQKMGESIKASILMITNVHFFLDADYFDLSASTKPLLHLWSLSIEEQFYIFWPFTLLLILKKAKNKALLAIFIIGLVSLALNLYGHFTNHAWISELFLKETANLDARPEIFFLLPFRVYEFLIGACLVFLPYKESSNRLRTALCFVGLILIAIATLTFDDKMIFPSYYGLFPSVGTALLIYFGSNNLITSMLSQKWLVSIGKVSYSFYLIHWPTFVFFHYLKFFQNGQIELKKTLAIIACLGLSYVSYYLVEQPFRKPNKHDRKIILAILVLLIVGFRLGSSFAKSGWPGRLATKINFTSTADYHTKFYGGAGSRSKTIFHKENKANLLLIGDSHALHYAHGLINEFAKPNGLNFYTFRSESCLRLPDFSRKTKGSDWDKLCTENYKEVVEFIKNSTLPNLIVMSHSWEAQRKRGKDLRDIKKEISFDRILEGVLEFKKTIGNNNLVLFSNVPTSNPFRVAEELSMPKEYRKIIPLPKHTFASPISTLNQNSISLNKALEDIKNSEQGLYVLNPYNALCDFEKLECLNIVNGDPTYSDSTHLSKTGSKFVIKFFEEEFNEILLKVIGENK